MSIYVNLTKLIKFKIIIRVQGINLLNLYIFQILYYTFSNFFKFFETKFFKF